MAAILIGGSILLAPYLNKSDSDISLQGSLRLCTITESTVAIGNQEATTVLAPGSRQWAIIQQPVNATNTPTISFDGAAVSGQGYHLATTTNTHLFPSELRFGFATDLPTANSVSVITDIASTTVTVISCK